MNQRVIGATPLWLVGVLIVALLSCGVEDTPLTATPVPTSTSVPTVEHTPIIFVTPLPSPTLFPPGFTPTPIPVPSPSPFIPTPTPLLTATPVPTATPTPTPTPIPIPCESGQCGLGRLWNWRDGTESTVHSRDLWPHLSIGERQIMGFMAQCQIEGVGYTLRARDGDRERWEGLIRREYLPDSPADVISVGLNPEGSVWRTSESWWEEEQIPISTEGAYQEGGSCLKVVVSPDLPPDRDGELRVRLVPQTTTGEGLRLEFGEGRYYISEETGYVDRYDVQMWWEGTTVLQELRTGTVMLHHFLSRGPGRGDSNAELPDPEAVAREAWRWCCSEEAKALQEELGTGF